MPDPPLEPAAPDPMSAMAPRFSLLFRWFARRFFRHFELDPKVVARLRGLESRGSVIYVMRYSSRLDYFLFNTLFRREGLRLSKFANGLRFYYYRPLLELVKIALFRPRGRPREIEHSEEREHTRRLTRAGESFFLFLRTARSRTAWSRRRARRRHDELGLIEDVVRTIWDGEHQVFLVPLALFWRKGPRAESRFLNLSYGAVTRPSDVSKVTSFLATYRDLSVKTGEPIDLSGFIAEQRADGPGVVARKTRRSILTYLYREEKVVEGPTLRASHRVQEQVLAAAGVQRAIAERAHEKSSSLEGARGDAEAHFREIAANMNSTFLAVLAWAVGLIFRRMFSSIEVTGLEKVASYAKQHPLVLVPSHRSYFDFLILSWLFYQNFLLPPHILARDNMAFGPFGFIFRRAGAFFMRQRIEDPLYKEVFRSYVAYLLREGLTQEFFIEGGRSRTGKTLPPKLGMLSWDVEAFLGSARRDLFFVPISICYERLVEEGSLVEELRGGEKQRETVIGLVRARKFLRSRFGSAHVSCGEPISLADALGDKRERFSGELGEEALREKRQFIENLGQKIVEHINWSAVANATSIAASVLLGSPHRGVLRSEMVVRMQQIVDLLRLQDVRLTPALEADEGEFSDSVHFMLRADLIRSASNPRGEILYFDESRRRALDIYRNAIVHYLATPSIMARQLLLGATPKELREDLVAWQTLLHREYFAPQGGMLTAHLEGFLDHFTHAGWVSRSGDTILVTASGRGILTCLAQQTRGVIEAYHAACSAALGLEGEVSRKEFKKLAAEHFEQSQLLGEAERREAAVDGTFDNAVELMAERGILERRVAEDKKSSDVTIARGEHSEALDELCGRLAAALADR